MKLASTARDPDVDYSTRKMAMDALATKPEPALTTSFEQYFPDAARLRPASLSVSPVGYGTSPRGR
jgi:hypothetical protein